MTDTQQQLRQIKNTSDSKKTFVKKIVKLSQCLYESKMTVLYTGPGIISGNPKNTNGYIYNTDDNLSKKYFIQNTKQFYKHYKENFDFRETPPQTVHKIAAQMEQTGLIKAVITENIDGLHRAAGSGRVYEIYGNAAESYCINCGKELGADTVFKSVSPIPLCPYCGGPVRPGITLKGEKISQALSRDIQEIIQKADMLIFAGISPAEYPARAYMKDFCGRYLVIIGAESAGENIERGIKEEETKRMKIGETDIVITNPVNQTFLALDVILKQRGMNKGRKK